MNRRSVTYPLSIYYDASCPLCAGEMHALKERDAHDRLLLIDCSSVDFADHETGNAGIARRELMRRIHARDAAGRWLDGVAVFEVAYRAVGIETVAWLWGHQWLRPIWDRVYQWVARNRMLLSRFGFARVFTYCVRMAAQRAERRSRGCTGKTACAVSASVD